MVTGASTASLALVLIDARNGIVEQSRRHAFITSLLRVPHLVLCVNKMDLVEYDEGVFNQIKDEFRSFATKLDIGDLSFIPISALKGDNVVHRSENMPWYDGTSLLHHLEDVHIASDRNLIDVRFPVQYVIRPQSTAYHDYRGYAGTVAGGVMKPGDEVLVLESGLTTTIESIDTADGQVDEAYPPMAVAVRLADDIDISRGDMICRPQNQPQITQDIDAMICWLTPDHALQVRGMYALKHTTRSVRAQVRDIEYRIDVNSLHRDETADTLSLNEIGRIKLRTTKPLFVDEYRRNRTTGSFLLIDESTGATVGAGMIL
jgi:bifunctional enzyme CysN/CysC